MIVPRDRRHRGKVIFCEGLDPAAVSRTLYKNGMLRRQDQKHLQCNVKIGNEQRRAYVLTAAILN